MNQEQETPQAGTCRESNYESSILNQEAVTPTPQEKKQQKIVERISELTGCEFPFIMASMVHDAVRTGLRITDKEQEENKGYPIHCSAEYHFMRMAGPGRDLVLPLYSVSMRLAFESRNFKVTLQPLARYLGVKEETLYAAAGLLVSAGFWEVIERYANKPTMYRPVTHKEWSEKVGTVEWNGDPVGKYCTVKAEFPFQDDGPEHELGQKLFGITGEKFFKGVLTGWLKVAPMGKLLAWAKDFMVEDGGAGTGIARRARLGNYFRQCASRECTDLT